MRYRPPESAHIVGKVPTIDRRFDSDLLVLIRDLPDEDLSCRMESSALTNLVQLQSTNRYVISDSTSPMAEIDRGLLRTRSGHAHSKVTFIELFFDLVFVFAVTQLSHLLMEHFTPAGAVETLLLMLAVWWVWIFTSWVTNWLDPEKLPVRFLLLAIMLAGLVMSSSLPNGF